MARDLKEVSATGNVTTSVPVFLRTVTLTPDGTNAASLVVKDGSGGSARLTLRVAGAGPSVTWRAGSKEGVLFSTAIHATLTGTGAVADFEYD
ncbi:hypothetical protein [Lysinibacillus fusiformis]|uniref:hypothetical protein n=1 Tax=Lysinibacillus fusiformis TaxID=28031 RepID=UPI003CFD3A27